MQANEIVTCYSSGVVGIERKALDDKLGDWLSYRGQQPMLITTLNVMGAFYRMFFFTYLRMYNTGNLPPEQNSGHTH